MEKFLNILEGLWNVFRKPFLSKEKLEIYNKRYKICSECEYNNKKYIKQCKLCGCFIRAKTMVDYPIDDENISIGGCPKYKW